MIENTWKLLRLEVDEIPLPTTTANRKFTLTRFCCDEHQACYDDPWCFVALAMCGYLIWFLQTYRKFIRMWSYICVSFCCSQFLPLNLPKIGGFDGICPCQLLQGYRYCADDILCAYLACQAEPDAKRMLDASITTVCRLWDHQNGGSIWMAQSFWFITRSHRFTASCPGILWCSGSCWRESLQKWLQFKLGEIPSLKQTYPLKIGLPKRKGSSVWLIKILSRLHLAVLMWILHPRLDLGSGIGSIGLGSLNVDRSWAVMLDDSHTPPLPHNHD